MKKKLSLLGLIVCSLFYSQASNTQTRDDAGAPTVISGFYQTNNPINYPSPGAGWWHLLDIRHTNPANNYGMQFAGSFNDQNLWFRKTNDNGSQPWSKVVMESPTGNVAVNGLIDTNLALKVYGRTQIKSDANMDAFSVLNDSENVGNGNDLIFLRYGKYQPDNPSVMTVSGMTTPTKYEAFFNLRANGKLGLGTYNFQTCSDCSEYRLFVKDGIKAEKVKVDVASTNGWADYVFKKDYKLQTLEEVEKHITEKGHLSNIPSANEVVEKGINLGEMDAKLLEKIEELTLYSIEQNKQIKKLQVENKLLLQQFEKIDALEKQIQEFLSSQK